MLVSPFKDVSIVLPPLETAIGALKVVVDVNVLLPVKVLSPAAVTSPVPLPPPVASIRTVPSVKFVKVILLPAVNLFCLRPLAA